MGELLSNHAIQSNKRLIAVVNSDAKRCDEMCSALNSFYNILSCNDGRAAIRSLIKNVPALIIVDEYVSPGNSLSFISAVRSEETLAQVPIIHVITNNNGYLHNGGKVAGANVILQYPFYRSFLIQTISKILNTYVEQGWCALPAAPQATLQNTSHVFKNIANVLMTGENIAFETVQSSCEPMLTAIQNNNFQMLLDGVKNHDDYTYAHSLRVATFLTLLGHESGFNEDEQLLLASGGLLHDIGKMKIPHSVLNKPGKLNEQEFDIMKTHVNHTVDYLKISENIPKGVFTIAEQHHEKIDGTGYPYGLQGSELNELARMTAVVDVFTALTDRRVYKESMTPVDAIAIMSEQMTSHLDAQYVRLFKGMIGNSGLLHSF
jgi:putative nucleotidyltransferase with HDIG domain